jgi:predicted ArsR family transcriptional regulator
VNVEVILERMRGVSESHTGWTFLTNHARVLAAIAEDRTTRIRDIAARCRLTERAIQKIISDLEEDGYLTHTRQGRTNEYRIEEGTILRHPADSRLSVADLLALVAQHDTGRGIQSRLQSRPRREQDADADR